MANEVHYKIDVTEAALDFGVSGAELNSLPAADIAWCAPVTTMTTCERAEITVAITVGGTSPEGTIEYYVARDTGTLIVADHHITLTDHGNEGTPADIEDIARMQDLVPGCPLVILPRLGFQKHAATDECVLAVVFAAH